VEVVETIREHLEVRREESEWVARAMGRKSMAYIAQMVE